jgi:hypothetical protein
MTVIWSLVGKVHPPERLQITAKLDGMVASGFTRTPGGYGNQGRGPGATLLAGAAEFNHARPPPGRCLSRRA